MEATQAAHSPNRLSAMLLAGAVSLAGLTAAATTSQQFGDGNAWDGALVPDQVRALWTTTPADGLGLSSNSFLKASRPCVSANGAQLFAYGDLADGSEAGKIVALDAQPGVVQWSQQVASYVSYWSASSPAFNGGYVYWAGSDATGAYVYKFDASTGAAAWTTKLPAVGSVASHAIVNASPVIGGGKATNVGFVDGHAEPLTERHTNCSTPAAVAPKTGFLSEDNSLYDLE